MACIQMTSVSRFCSSIPASSLRSEATHSGRAATPPPLSLQLPSCRKHSQAALLSVICRASSSDPAPPQAKTSSIICEDCEGNGAVVCKQCQGGGLNLEDHFQGRFKAGTTCWLCRGKRQVLCGSCNGAGFVGGFMSTKDE